MTLNDLLALNTTDGDSIKKFNPDSSTELGGKPEKARSKKAKEHVKRMTKSKNVMVLDSDSDDGWTDSDNGSLLDD